MFSFSISFVKSLRRITSFTAVCVLLSGCGLAQKHIDPALQFDQSNEKAVVIGGVNITGNKNFNSVFLLFWQYDEKSQRLMPDGNIFSFEDSFIYDDLSLSVIESGNYAMVAYVYDPGGRVLTINSPDKNSLGGIEENARIGGVNAFRFKIEPGQALYLGEYVIGAFKPKWVNQEDVLAAQLAKMPNFKAKPVFHPPVMSNN